MKKTVDTKNAYLLVRRVQSNPTILLAHSTALSKVVLAWYNLTRVELNTFNFSVWIEIRAYRQRRHGPLPQTPAFHHD